MVGLGLPVRCIRNEVVLARVISRLPRKQTVKTDEQRKATECVQERDRIDYISNSDRLDFGVGYHGDAR